MALLAIKCALTDVAVPGETYPKAVVMAAITVSGTTGGTY
jgi:hypothetical protein